MKPSVSAESSAKNDDFKKKKIGRRQKKSSLVFWCRFYKKNIILSLF
jgi:hypothetical protein